MPTLEITPEIDRAIAAVFDAALKQKGWAILGSIDVVRGAIKAAQVTAAIANPPGPPGGNGVNGMPQ